MAFTLDIFLLLSLNIEILEILVFFAYDLVLHFGKELLNMA